MPHRSQQQNGLASEEVEVATPHLAQGGET